MTVQRKPDRPDSHQEGFEDWRCQTCGVHFGDPLSPESEVEA
jgi:hypothetical protein